MILLVIIAQLSLADQLYDAGCYGAAELEYRRDLYYDRDSSVRRHNRLRLSSCCHFNGKPEEAVSTLKELIDQQADQRHELSRHLVRLYVRNGYYALARMEIDGLLKAPAADSLERSVRRLSAINNLYREEYETAVQDFTQAGDTTSARRTEAYLEGPRKSVFKAVLLSSIIPGSGCLYTGNYRLAAVDFLANCGSALLIYNALRQKKTFDALLVVSFLTARFYAGARSNAMHSALEYNERKRRAWLAGIEPTFEDEIKIE